MFQPIIIYLKSGEVGFCVLKYSEVTDLKNQVDSISMSEDVDRVGLESHLPVLDMEHLNEQIGEEFYGALGDDSDRQRK